MYTYIYFPDGDYETKQFELIAHDLAFYGQTLKFYQV